MNKYQKNEIDLSGELIKKEVCKSTVLAIQVEMEEEQLLEWRNKRKIVNTREANTKFRTPSHNKLIK